MSDLSRRDFLRGAAAVTGTAALLAVGGRPRLAASSARFASAPDSAAVVVARGSNADSYAAILQAALEGLGGIGRFVKPGQTVAIKPNATWAYPPGTASSTDPGLLAALITMVRDAGAARVVVVDRSTLWPVTQALQQTGIGKVLDDLGVERVIPDGPVAPAKLCEAVELPQGKAFKKLNALKAALEADVRINLAVAKSHKVTKYTLCLKHMMGFLQTPGQIHTRLEQGIADLSSPSPLAAQLHILEAVRVRLVGQAGGRQTELTHPQVVARPNEIVAGVDPVLIDAYGLETYFSRKPKELAHVYLAGQAGTGELDLPAARESGRLRIIVIGQAAEAAQDAGAPASGPQTQPSPTDVRPTSTPGPTKARPASVSSPTSTSAQAGQDVASATAPATASATPTAAPSPTLTASATPTVPTATPSVVPTNTPLPTAAVVAAGAIAGAGAAAACPPAAALDAGRFMNLALLPVAAVVAGAGIVLRGRLGRAADEQGDEPGNGPPIEYRDEPEQGHADDADAA